MFLNNSSMVKFERNTHIFCLVETIDPPFVLRVTFPSISLLSWFIPIFVISLLQNSSNTTKSSESRNFLQSLLLGAELKDSMFLLTQVLFPALLGPCMKICFFFKFLSIFRPPILIIFRFLAKSRHFYTFSRWFTMKGNLSKSSGQTPSLNILATTAPKL